LDLSEDSSKLIPIHEEPNHQIVHLFRLGKANCDGRSNSDEEPEESVMHIPRGSSRDQRPDLNQVLLALVVEHHAGIPVLMKPLSGNRSDAQDFGHIITDHIAQWQITYGTTCLVADRALSRAENLQKLAETRTKWITRVPAT